MLVAGRVDSWPVASFAEVTFETLAPIVTADGVELLLIGAGTQFAVVPPDLRERFRPTGIAVDAMDTGAACRTYNVLLAEGRQLAAALIAVD